MLIEMVSLAAPTGAAFRDWIITVAGIFFSVILVLRSLQYYAAREWGTFFGHIGVSVVVAVICFATGAFVNVLTTIGQLILGTS
ncbi:hypothetical protein ACQPXM_41165 (plasmid) [Kribbella sp. CA-253562]|uniref:hypothetical protein n=1 Tax=Kribbella sp. CA-253562 TaxID=3239942 RepID=UPI003D91009A